MHDALLAPAAARAISGGISDSTLRRLIALGDYPQPIVLSRRRNGRPARIAFAESEVRDWVAAKIAQGR